MAWAFTHSMLLTGCSGVDEPASAAAAKDLADRSGLGCVALSNITSRRPSDLEARLRAFEGPGWLIEERLFVGSSNDLAQATMGIWIGDEDGRSYVNGRRDDGSWVTFVAEPAQAGREAWFTTLRVPVACG